MKSWTSKEITTKWEKYLKIATKGQDDSHKIKQKVPEFVLQKKKFYLIQLQSHYTPAPELTDNQACISGNVNISKSRCSKVVLLRG